MAHYIFRRMTTSILYVLLLFSSLFAQNALPVYPDTTWLAYATPEEAGWSSEGIANARSLADSLGSKAIMLIYKGAIVTEWGDTEDAAPIASIRKSLFSALIGIAVEEEKIDTAATLADLGIDDLSPLTDQEKQARISHLLTTSSGVYHTAAGEPPGLQKPERGSAAPGEQWYYNNWDFNVLGTIYEQETGTPVFKAFGEKIAGPIGMENYNTALTRYSLQPDRSEHPAYDMWMSARDLARFGLLYLRNGMWKDHQVVPADWVQASIKVRKVIEGDFVAGYGLSWWIPGGRLQEYSTFTASGAGNQSIMILPELDIVYVHRASAILEPGVNGLDAREILFKLLDAHVYSESDKPRLVPVAR